MPRVQINFYLYAKDVERAVQFYLDHFGFKLEGQIEPGEQVEWAALRTENAILWLGPAGAKTGLIILIEKNLAEIIAHLREMGVTIFIPEELKSEDDGDSLILETYWGKHSWIIDSEENIVMLFEPAEG